MYSVFLYFVGYFAVYVEITDTAWPGERQKPSHLTPHANRGVQAGNGNERVYDLNTKTYIRSTKCAMLSTLPPSFAWRHSHCRDLCWSPPTFSWPWLAGMRIGGVVSGRNFHYRYRPRKTPRSGERGHGFGQNSEKGRVAAPLGCRCCWPLQGRCNGG